MARFDKDWVSAYFEHGVDVFNRRIFLGEIDEGTVDAAVKGLYLMETNSKTTPCEIFISSEGGSLYEALALYDIINTLRCPIYTFAYGKCQSAAPLLLAAGEPGQRWVAPNVAFMHHDWSAEVDGKGSQVAAWARHHETVGQTWTRLLSEHSSKDFRFWNSRAKRAADFFFGAEDAIEWGIADQMWVEKGE